MRRLKWAQTLVQDPSHHAQVLTAMFGKLPAESSATLNSEGELTPEANPWALRWMEDLEALQPYDERGVVQRMGKNVRALFLDRELAADFVAIDVSVLRLQSQSTQVPPWDFREEVGHPMEVSQEGLNEMTELKKLQSSTFDTESRIRILFWNLLARYRICKTKLIV